MKIPILDPLFFILLLVSALFVNAQGRAASTLPECRRYQEIPGSKWEQIGTFEHKNATQGIETRQIIVNAKGTQFSLLATFGESGLWVGGNMIEQQIMSVYQSSRFNTIHLRFDWFTKGNENFTPYWLDTVVTHCKTEHGVPFAWDNVDRIRVMLLL